MSRKAFAALERAETRRRANIDERADYARRYPQITGARFYIWGESKMPRDGFRLFVCEIPTTDGHEYIRVWARDADEARLLVLPYRGGKLATVEEVRG